MMRVAFITRSTLYTVPGGDTVQAIQTARQLGEFSITVDILLSNETILYERYDLLHFFNLTRPADILYHSKKGGKPFVVSTILCNYSEYDKQHRRGIGSVFSCLAPDSIEYLKTMARCLLGRDHLASMEYTWKGQRRSIMEILDRANMILPNSESEYARVRQNYPSEVKCMVVPNGANPELFKCDKKTKKNDRLVVCAARIEGVKNQLNLIMALNNTKFRLILIGSHSRNQHDYYMQCRDAAAFNVSFIDHIPQHELVDYYREAKVHILPSWFETTGLSSIEAAAMGCNIVITDKGDTREYFGDDAFYCDPSNPGSILAAVEKASSAALNENLQKKILEKYTWQQAALQTSKAYQLATTA